MGAQRNGGANAAAAVEAGHELAPVWHAALEAVVAAGGSLDPLTDALVTRLTGGPRGPLRVRRVCKRVHGALLGAVGAADGSPRGWPVAIH